MSQRKDTLYGIGEALIDFIPTISGCSFSEVPAFAPAVGGAPANVCAVYAKLGGRASMITQVGDDPFGHKICETLEDAGVDLTHVYQTDQANTTLAFVSLQADGGRTFSFYRKPSADMLLAPSQIHAEWFENAFALHFCAVSLGDYPMKEAHRRAISDALSQNTLISFDPNLRFPLWPDHEALYRTVWEFLPYAHILKISDEELSFITGTDQIEEALPKLFIGNVQLVLYTCGKDGAMAFTKKVKVQVPGCPVHAIDTTGAGDAFVGAFLYQLHEQEIGLSSNETTSGSLENRSHSLENISAKQLEKLLTLANGYAADSTTRKGAIPAYADHFS